MKKLYCFSRKDAKIFYREEMNWYTNADLPDDVAIISIAGTPDSQEKYLHDKEDHWFLESGNVLKLNFDDISEDEFTYKGVVFHGLTDEDATRAIEFIIRNIDKDFYVNCRAGKSRSQAFIRFIQDLFLDRENEFNPNNLPEHSTPNPGVLQKLKHIYTYDFWDIYYELSKFLKITYKDIDQSGNVYFGFGTGNDSVIIYRPNEIVNNNLGNFLYQGVVFSSIDELRKKIC